MSDTAEARIRKDIRQKVLARAPFHVRKSRARRVPIAAEVLAARKEFVARWHALTAEGVEAGYLEWTDERSNSIEPVEETEIVDGRDWTESESEYEARVDAEVERQIAVALEESFAKR